MTGVRARPTDRPAILCLSRVPFHLFTRSNGFCWSAWVPLGRAFVGDGLEESPREDWSSPFVVRCRCCVGVGEKCQIHQPWTVTSLSGEVPCRAVSLVSDRLCRACNRMSGQGAAHLRPSGEEGVGQGIKVPRAENRCWSLVHHLLSCFERVCPVCLFLPQPSIPRVHASHTCRCCCVQRVPPVIPYWRVASPRQDTDICRVRIPAPTHPPRCRPKNARNQSPAPSIRSWPMDNETGVRFKIRKWPISRVAEAGKQHECRAVCTVTGHSAYRVYSRSIFFRPNTPFPYCLPKGGAVGSISTSSWE